MVNIQNEIRYSIAWDILRKLLFDEIITRSEYEAAHRILIEKCRPMTVQRLG